MNLLQGAGRAVVLTALVSLSLLAFGCSDDGEPFEGSRPRSPTALPVESRSPQPGATGEGVPSPHATTGTAPEAPLSGLPEVDVERVFGDLEFERPTGLYADPGGNWFLTEQAGRVFYFPPFDDAQPTLVLDITDRVSTGGSEEGLLGLAIGPDYKDAAFYVYYSAANPRRGVLSRFTLAPPDADTAASEEVILEVPEPFANHNGGQIAFGPDGFLYLSLGDGGGGNDQNGNGQNLGTLLGAILRIDISGGGAKYEVPRDNPFVGQAGARGEIWAFGLRNPWRFSFDRETGELWVGDVGQNTREEVDLVVRGGNYGWNITEGFDCRGGGSRCNSDGLLSPVFDYATGSGGTCSVTGGFVYRGSAIPELRGAYVFSDYCSGVIYALRAQDGVLNEQDEIASTGLNVSSFAQDNEGELYVLDLGGGIYKLVP